MVYFLFIIVVTINGKKSMNGKKEDFFYIFIIMGGLGHPEKLKKMKKNKK